jgi:hypothetical protein
MKSIIVPAKLMWPLSVTKKKSFVQLTPARSGNTAEALRAKLKGEKQGLLHFEQTCYNNITQNELNVLKLTRTFWYMKNWMFFLNDNCYNTNNGTARFA